MSASLSDNVRTMVIVKIITQTEWVELYPKGISLTETHADK